VGVFDLTERLPAVIVRGSGSSTSTAAASPLAGWQVEIADAQKVKGLAPLARKTDKIDAWVLAEQQDIGIISNNFSQVECQANAAEDQHPIGDLGADRQHEPFGTPRNAGHPQVSG
jgi:hypothetical protein